MSGPVYDSAGTEPCREGSDLTFCKVVEPLVKGLVSNKFQSEYEVSMKSTFFKKNKPAA